jgi:hypothetical protein
MATRDQIKDGMKVRTDDGSEIGRVKSHDDDQFIIESGVFFSEDYVASYDSILDVRDDEIIYEAVVEEIPLDAEMSGQTANVPSSEPLGDEDEEERVPPRARSHAPAEQPAASFDESEAGAKKSSPPKTDDDQTRKT